MFGELVANIYTYLVLYVVYNSKKSHTFNCGKSIFKQIVYCVLHKINFRIDCIAFEITVWFTERGSWGGLRQRTHGYLNLILFNLVAQYRPFTLIKPLYFD